MTTTTLSRSAASEKQLESVEVKVIDTDVHIEPRSFDELVGYMAAPWRDRAIKERIPFRRAGFTTFDLAARMDAYPETGDVGSDPGLVERHLFIDDPIDYAILLPWSYRGFTVDPALDTALAGAVNTWLAETWLSKYNTENRYIGSITVSVEDPIGAVREIEKWGGHPGFRQVAISHYGPRPFGHPMYDQIWAAAARYELPISVHFKGGATQPLGWTSTGPLQYFVEYHSLVAPMAYAAHMASWICNGVLDRHPQMQVLFLEGGFLWHRPLVDRMQRHWQRTAKELPTRKTPLQYARDHFRFASQPIEEANDPQQIAALFMEADAGDLLMFSSDYPHYDYDPPSRALPKALRADIKKRIMAGNALAFFDLPKTRPLDRFDRETDRT